MHTPGTVIVQASDVERIVEGIWNGGKLVDDGLKVGVVAGRAGICLLDALRTAEKEEFVLDDITADITAKLIALERRGSAVHIGKTSAGILEIVERIAME